MLFYLLLLKFVFQDLGFYLTEYDYFLLINSPLHSVLPNREKLVLLVLVDLRVLRDRGENLALLDHLDHLAPV